MKTQKSRSSLRVKRNGQAPADLSNRQINTHLPIPDQAVFDAERKARWPTDAHLLRHIVHEWAKKKRLATGDSKEQESTIKEIYETTVSEQLEPVKKSISAILERLDQLTDPSQPAATSETRLTTTAGKTAPIDAIQLLELLHRFSNDISGTQKRLSELAQILTSTATQHGEQLSLSKVMMKHLLDLNKSHYHLSGQSFAAIWSALDFIQRYVVEPHLQTLGKTDPYEASKIHRDEARKEGLQLVIEMCHLFKFPSSMDLTLISPPEEP